MVKASDFWQRVCGFKSHTRKGLFFKPKFESTKFVGEKKNIRAGIKTKIVNSIKIIFLNFYDERTKNVVATD